MAGSLRLVRKKTNPKRKKRIRRKNPKRRAVQYKVSRAVAIRRLTTRWHEQGDLSPTFRNEITLKKYIAANINYVMKNDVLSKYDRETNPCRKSKRVRRKNPSRSRSHARSYLIQAVVVSAKRGFRKYYYTGKGFDSVREIAHCFSSSSAAMEKARSLMPKMPSKVKQLSVIGC